MPSCSSKLSILRGYEFSDFIENFEYYKSGIVNLLICLYLSCSSQTVNDLKVPWCCAKTNISSNHLSGSLKVCHSPEHYALVSSVYKTKHRLAIFILDLLTPKGEEQRGRNILHQRDKQINHNVIWLIILCYLSRLVPLYILQNQYKLTKLINKLSYISYGNIFNSVMEVDETVEEINSHVGILPNGNEINLKSPSDVCKSECDHSTVINDNQIMNKLEFTQINNSVMHPNSIDATIRDDKIDTVINGDINNCIINLCDDSTVDLCNDSTVDLEEDSQTDNKLIVKNEEKANGKVEEIKLENSESCEPKETKPNDVISDQKVENEDKVKSSESIPNDISSDKTKSEEKNDSTSLNHVSSSSSSKKHESQSRSHQSSSSSSSSRYKYKDSRDDRHKSSSSSSRNNEVSSSRRSEDKSKSDSRSKSRSCHHKPEEKCHCKSRHHSSHHHSKKSKKFQSVKTQCSAEEIVYELKQNKTEEVNPYFTRVPWVPHPQLANLKYGRFYRIEVDRNGGASVCHLYMDEISHLSEEQIKECAIDFIKLSYSEDENECAHHVMGIVHGAATYLPDLVDYMADHYPTLTVKTGSLASRDNHTTTMSQYRDEVYKTYSNGTFRYAPLDQLSICGVLGEEVGAYFPDFVARLEQSPFMKPVMPWSFLSVVQTDNPRESNDGPIFWVRPGEQMLPANEALKESARPKKRRNNELDNLAYIGGSRSSEARESLFMDRTKAHADQVGVDYGISNTAPTAAVGVLKAVNCGHPEHGNRATKDVVAFHAQDYSELLEILMLDLYEPPQTQCTKWIEVSKLNTMRREGIRYAHLQLHDNDVYYLPRKIIHQFQTISSVASVAWHIRYRDYFLTHGAPNLHTPTGINKGQVFYEKKNVAVYCPPLSENELLAAVANGESILKTPKKSDRLREYSPFKHSPRKLQKHQSPRSVSKKDKQSESVPLPPPPPPQLNNIKKESEEGNGDSDKKSSGSSSSSSSGSSSSKKHQRSKSAERRLSTDRGIKREHDTESRRTSDSSHSRRSSGEHTPSKKEHRSQESHSSHHRKEVKNLEAEFSSKKDKSSRERSPKSKHERKRSSDESRHEGSSKHRRHDESSKSRSSSSSSKHEKSREHGSSSSSSSSVPNGDSSHKVKTEDKKEGEKEASLKRKHEDSPISSPAKKIKEENPDPGVVENGRKSPEGETSSESQSGERTHANGLSMKNETSSADEIDCKNVNKCSESSETNENDSDERPSSTSVINNEMYSRKVVNDFDLRKHVSFGSFNNQVPSPTPLPTVNSPPPKVVTITSMTATTAMIDSNSTNSLPESAIVQMNSHRSESVVSSKDKTGDVQLKKFKKKVVKKENESYDLLGDIMSQMDKNK